MIRLALKASLIGLLVLGACSKLQNQSFQGWIEANLVFISPDESGRIETLSVREGLALVASVVGVDRPVRTLPPWLAMGAATIVEALGRVRRRRPSICRELARTLTHGHAYDGSKATRELGLRYTPIEETLRRTVDWWVEQRLVRSAS